jgi:hypothetical protein
MHLVGYFHSCITMVQGSMNVNVTFVFLNLNSIDSSDATYSRSDVLLLHCYMILLLAI